MDAEKFVTWSLTAKQLAANWTPSMRSKGAVVLDEEIVESFLMDLWIDKKGDDPIFHPDNRGRLYNYTLQYVLHPKDALFHSNSISEDDDRDEDRMAFWSCDTAEAEDDEAGDDASLEDIFDQEDSAAQSQLAMYLDQLELIKDGRLPSALSDVFGFTDRSGRTCAAAIRQEKIAALIRSAARTRGITDRELRKLGEGILAQEIKQKRIDDDSLASFAALIGIKTSADEKRSEKAHRKTPGRARNLVTT